jgi:hypothetical protein
MASAQARWREIMRFALVTKQLPISPTPVLGPRLLGCTKAVLTVAGRSAHDVLGSPDDLKFRSSMTLFAALGTELIFGSALDRFYGGIPDESTLAILTRWRSIEAGAPPQQSSSTLPRKTSDF